MYDLIILVAKLKINLNSFQTPTTMESKKQSLQNGHNLKQQKERDFILFLKMEMLGHLQRKELVEAKQLNDICNQVLVVVI